MNNSFVITLGLISAVGLLLVSSLDWRRSLKAVFILVLFEGAIRKWVLPSASDLVYFAKDVILIGAYLGVIFKERFSIRDAFPNLPWPAMQVCWMVLLLEMMNPNLGSVLCALLGARGYLFYLPMAFLMPHLFRSKAELTRGLARYALLSIPICILGVLQFKSDRFSVINKYASGIEDFGVSGFGIAGEDLARITGTFSYLSGHMAFVCAFLALNVALLYFDRLPYRTLLSYVTLPLICGNALMSGSRAALYVQGLVVVGFIAYGVSTKIKSYRARSVGLIAATILCGGAAATIFSDALFASTHRLKTAEGSFLERVYIHPARDMSVAWARGGLWGCGIGSTSSTIYSLRERLKIRPPVVDPGLYDNEACSIVAEVGFVGAVAWYVFRIIVVFSLFQNARHQRDPNSKAIAFSGFLLSFPFFLLSLLMNPTASVLFWGLWGLGMAERPYVEVSKKPTFNKVPIPRRRAVSRRRRSD